jgi:hypothetical protein
MLTPRENLLRIFGHGVPAWIPVCGHVDPYNQPNRDGMDPYLAEQMSAVEWHDLSTVLFSRWLGLDIMDYMGLPVRVSRRNVAVEVSHLGDDSVETWHTPAGQLRQVSRRCREDGTSYLVEHMVKSPADIAPLAALFEDEVIEVDPAALAAIRERRELIGDDGMLMCFMPGTPMGMMFRVYSGVVRRNPSGRERSPSHSLDSEGRSGFLLSISHRSRRNAWALPVSWARTRSCTRAAVGDLARAEAIESVGGLRAHAAARKYSWWRPPRIGRDRMMPSEHSSRGWGSGVS